MCCQSVVETKVNNGSEEEVIARRDTWSSRQTSCRRTEKSDISLWFRVFLEPFQCFQATDELAYAPTIIKNYVSMEMEELDTEKVKIRQERI